MELVFGDVLKKNQWIIDTLNTFFSTMQSQNKGKASTKFHEIAAELNNIILANKAYQTTRFVRSLLRCLTAALRNLPTLFTVIAREHHEAALKNNNTRGKELEKIMSNLQNGKILIFIIGLTQILEIYCIVSVEVQHASHYPIQSWASIDSAKEQLAKLAENWSWDTQELKLSGIGTPQSIVNNIIESKSYTPFVPIGSIKRNIGKVEFEIDIGELFNPDGSKKNIANIPLFDEEQQRELEPAGKFFHLRSFSIQNKRHIKIIFLTFF